MRTRNTEIHFSVISDLGKQIRQYIQNVEMADLYGRKRCTQEKRLMSKNAFFI